MGIIDNAGRNSETEIIFLSFQRSQNASLKCKMFKAGSFL